MENAEKSFLYNDLSEKIIGCAHKVYYSLGTGFLEKVYENALVKELGDNELNVLQQYPIKVYYKGTIVGEYIADIFVEKKIIVEVKSVIELSKIHETQLVNYLKATGLKVGLLINFGSDIAVRRKVLYSEEEKLLYK
jgi:GxxExxY protein